MELMSIEYQIKNKILLDTGDVCTIHNKPYYRRMTREGEYNSIAMCLDCWHEKMLREDQANSERQTLNSMLAKTWATFESVSVIPSDLKMPPSRILRLIILKTKSVSVRTKNYSLLWQRRRRQYIFTRTCRRWKKSFVNCNC